MAFLLTCKEESPAFVQAVERVGGSKSCKSKCSAVSECGVAVHHLLLWGIQNLTVGPLRYLTVSDCNVATHWGHFIKI